MDVYAHQVCELPGLGQALIVIKYRDPVDGRPEVQSRLLTRPRVRRYSVQQRLRRLLPHELQLGLGVAALEPELLRHEAVVPELRVPPGRQRQEGRPRVQDGTPEQRPVGERVEMRVDGLRAC